MKTPAEVTGTLKGVPDFFWSCEKVLMGTITNPVRARADFIASLVIATHDPAACRYRKSDGLIDAVLREI